MTTPNKEKKSEFLVNIYFDELTHNQKIAILMFYSIIAEHDSDPDTLRYKTDFINHYFQELGVTQYQFEAYVTLGGREQMIKDIKSLDKYNFTHLVWSTTEMGEYGKGMPDSLYRILAELVNELGIDFDTWTDFLDKSEEMKWGDE